MTATSKSCHMTSTTPCLGMYSHLKKNNTNSPSATSWLTFYDIRWESSPWTACSTSCGGGIQSRSVSCVEEDMQGVITPTEEWKCLYSPKTAILQPCNTFDCPTWLAQEWSPVGALFSLVNISSQNEDNINSRKWTLKVILNFRGTVQHQNVRNVEKVQLKAKCK